ncbi:MAG: glucosylglycerol-phosphate synthase [Myxococcales bacterium]|nr:glucosylglycerol-phosphate synthase [Myxococcales bacterium]
MLATDLDGTFLGGSPAERERLYALLRRHRHEVVIIYITGRGLEGVMPLLAMPELPQPDLIICDVGATVVYGKDLQPLQPLQNEIEQQWPGTHAVRRAFDAFAGLHRQHVPQERRCSYYANAADINEALYTRAHELDCDLVFSAGRYLDILPRGINKGTTLDAVVAHLGLPANRVLTAGDTLNDLALLQTTYRGVVVGNAEPSLIAALPPDQQRLYHARHEGAGGILEALRYFDLVSEAELAEVPARVATDADAKAELVMLYHRLPFQEHTRGGVTHFSRHSSPNGIIPTLLGLFRKGQRGAWVAWTEASSRSAAAPVTELAIDADGNLTPGAVDKPLRLERIALTKADIDLYYKKFAKEALWPVLFSFPSKVTIDHDHWAHFVEVNRLFANRTAATAKFGATVWLHDYNLWMVPALLRPQRPDLTLAFFHHTAFPAADIFNILPWARDIVVSLMQCDYLGFHIPRYIENFVDVARAMTGAEIIGRQPCAPRFKTYGCSMGVPEMTHTLRFAGRDVRLGAHPVGIDVDQIERLLAQQIVQARVEALREEFRGKQCVLSVERLDYVKGPIEKLRAFRDMLVAHPELHGKVVLVSICTPAAPGMEVYQGTRRQVDELVGQINGEFSTVGWTPIRYFYRSLPFEELVAYYAACDVAWVTPLRDGLNLVAKEFVAAQAAIGSHGVLVVSEFAGAAVELHGAMLTNPYDGKHLADTLFAALHLDPVDRRLRAERLASIVREHDVAAWGEGFLAAAQQRRVYEPPGS